MMMKTFLVITLLFSSLLSFSETDQSADCCNTDASEPNTGVDLSETSKVAEYVNNIKKPQNKIVTLADQYCFANNKDTPLTPQIEQAIHSAFKMWSEVMAKALEMPFAFKFTGSCKRVLDDNDNMHTVMFEPTSNSRIDRLGRASPRFMGDNERTIHSGSDIQFNSRWKYSPSEKMPGTLVTSGYYKKIRPELILDKEVQAKPFCLESLVAHEIGHALGADHTIGKADTLMCSEDCDLNLCVTRPTKNEIKSFKKTYKKFKKRIKTPSSQE